MVAHMEEALERPLHEVLSLMQRRIMTQTTYFGIPTMKNPLDYWVYQELIFDQKPDVIIEIGNASGGSTLAFAHLCDLMGKGRIIGLDISHADVSDLVKKHPRVTLIEGPACDSFHHVQKMLKQGEKILVIEDSSHSFENTLNVLRTFSPLIPPGGYFIVEDSICNHGLNEGPVPGPYEAIEVFVRENHDFNINREKESFLITWNPKGYLRRNL